MSDSGYLFTTTAGARRSLKALYWSVCLLVAASGSGQSPKPQITIAAAANLTVVFQTLGPRFEAQTGIHPVFSFASTAQLARQIENGAPFDVFAAADAQHIDELDRKGLLTPGSAALYATGILGLWIPPRSKAAVSNLAQLTQPRCACDRRRQAGAGALRTSHRRDFAASRHLGPGKAEDRLCGKHQHGQAIRQLRQCRCSVHGLFVAARRERQSAPGG